MLAEEKIGSRRVGYLHSGGIKIYVGLMMSSMSPQDRRKPERTSVRQELRQHHLIRFCLFITGRGVNFKSCRAIRTSEIESQTLKGYNLFYSVSFPKDEH